MSINFAVLVPAHNPGPMTGAGNNTWLIDGREPTLIDAGVGHVAHVDAVAERLDGRPLARVLVTHGHADHSSGVTALRARWPAIEACKWIQSGDDGWQPLNARASIVAGDGELDVIHTPGHAPDHVCFFDAQTRALFSGDMLVLGSTVMIPAGRGGNLRDYLASLDRLAALQPMRAFPGHGAIIERPVALIDEYIAHRRLRESQVLERIAAGITDVDAMVARIYPNLAMGVLPAARATIEAHLEKLRDEGRV